MLASKENKFYISYPPLSTKAAQVIEHASLRCEDPRKPGIGGAPTRATILPTEASERKQFPIASGFMDYFPDSIAAIANISYRGGQQHHPDKPIHWDREKSTDEADTMMRHFLQRGTLDTDGVRHTAKMCWRALALLQKEIEEDQSKQK